MPRNLTRSQSNRPKWSRSGPPPDKPRQLTRILSNTFMHMQYMGINSYSKIAQTSDEGQANKPRRMTILGIKNSFRIPHKAMADLRRDEVCEGESAEVYSLRAQDHESNCWARLDELEEGRRYIRSL
ncbi:hypothetical protein N7453_009356 [Penicillium expansum]|nr:hypothetical protein N7453_009356 [Penicillium expansum]